MMNWQYDMWDEDMFETYEKRRLRRKQYYRKREKERRRHMYGTNSKKNLEESLLQAAFHAKSISERTIISEAKVRKGEFVTSLRREIKDRHISHHYSKFTDKDSWTDILVPSSYAKFSNEELAIISRVRRDAMDAESPVAIERGIKNLSKQVSGAMNILKEIDSINREAEEIINGFKQLATEM